MIKEQEARELYQRLKYLAFAIRKDRNTQQCQKIEVIRSSVIQKFASSIQNRLTGDSAVKTAEAILLHQKGLYQDAICKYRQTLNQPTCIQSLTFFNMGLCYEALGNLAQSEYMYRYCLSLYSSCSPAARNLVSLLLRTNFFDKALEVAANYPHAVNKSAVCLYNIALLHYFRKEYEKSIDIFNQLTQIDQKSNLKSKSIIMVGKILERTQRGELALLSFSALQRKIKSPALGLHMRILEIQCEENKGYHQIKPIKPVNSLSGLKNSKFFMNQSFQKEVQNKSQTERNRIDSRMNSIYKHSDKDSAMKSTMVSISTSLFSDGKSSQRISNIISEVKDSDYKSRTPAASFLSDRKALPQIDQKNSSVYSRSEKNLSKEVHPTKKICWILLPVQPLLNAEDLPVPQFDFNLESRPMDFYQSLPLDKLPIPESVEQQEQEVVNPLPETQAIGIPNYSNVSRKSVFGKSLTMDPTQLQLILKKSSKRQIKQPLQRYNQALELANNGNFKQAIIGLRNILTDCDHQEKLKASSLIADIYQTLDMPDRAAIYLRRLVEDDEATGYLKLSRLYESMGRTDKASVLLRKGLGKHSKDSKFFERLGWLSLNQNQISQGIDYLQKAYSLNRQSRGVRRKLLHAYSLQGSTSQKWKSLLVDMYSEEEGDIDTDSKIAIGLFLQTQFFPKRRQQILKELFSSDPQNACFLILLGRAAIEQGNYAEGFIWLKKSIQKSYSVKPLVQFSQLFRLSQDYDVSKKLLKQAQEQNEKDSEVLCGIGAVQIDKGNYKQAIKYYRKVLDDDQHDFRALSKIGYCYWQLELPEKALSYYKKSLCVNSNQPEVLRDMASVCSQFGSLEKALHYYKLARQLDICPDFSSSIGEVDCLIKCGKYSQALQFMSFIPKNHGEKEIAAASAVCNYYLNQYEKAITWYVKCNQIEESDEWHFNIGACYHKMGRWKNAQGFYSSCMQLNPRHTKALFNQGIICKEQGKDKQAIDFIKRSVDIEFVENWVLLLVQLYIDSKKYTEAFAQVNRILDAESVFVREKAAYFHIKTRVELFGVDQTDEFFHIFYRQYPSSAFIPELKILHQQDHRHSLVSLVISEQVESETKFVSFKN